MAHVYIESERLTLIINYKKFLAAFEQLSSAES